jgi:hypothetical protein
MPAISAPQNSLTQKYHHFYASDIVSTTLLCSHQYSSNVILNLLHFKKHRTIPRGRLFHVRVTALLRYQTRSRSGEKPLLASSWRAVRPSARIRAAPPPPPEVFLRNFTLGNLHETLEKLQMWLKSDNNIGHCKWRRFVVAGDINTPQKHFCKI